MGDSLDNGAAGAGGEDPNLNAGAKEWTPNVSAASWTPSWLPAGQQEAAPAAPAEEAAPAAPAEEAAETAAAAAAPEAEVAKPAPQVSLGKSEAAKEEEDEEEQAEEAAPKEEPPAKAAPAAEEDQAKGSEAPKAVAQFDEAGFAKEKVKQLKAIENADKREHLNVVFIGHVDAGKSTLSGSILYEMGSVDKRTIEKFEQEAKERNRESWFLAYIMDTNEEERAKGKTVEVGRAYFETDHRRCTILDAPGHKNYVPAMISGASQADVGILVISARKGEFEAGFEGLGQTREHAMLAKTLGIQKLIIVINKMDEQTVQWNKDRFDECVKKLRPFLKGCGYKVKRDVTFLPISALQGVGVKRRVSAKEAEWAMELNGGKSLLEILDTTSVGGRDAEVPLRMTVVDRYTDRGVVLMGKVESGVCYVGQTVCVCPNQQEVKVEGLQINEEDVNGAKPGENVLVRLPALSENEVSKGHVVCSRFSPIGGCTEIIAQLYIVGLLEHRPLFSAGYNAVFHAHTAEEACTVYELVATLDSSGKIAKKSPAFAKAGQTLICKVRLDLSVCLEPYDKTMQLGRFTLRDEGKSIAIGVIKKCR